MDVSRCFLQACDFFLASTFGRREAPGDRAVREDGMLKDTRAGGVSRPRRKDRAFRSAPGSERLAPLVPFGRGLFSVDVRRAFGRCHSARAGVGLKG